MKNTNATSSSKQFHDIQERLAEIVADFGYLKGRSVKVSKILAYLYIRREVTQQLLHELTGYSLGTISAALRDLEESGMVRKNRSPDSPWRVYTIEGPLSQVLSRSMMDFPVYLSQVDELLKQINAKLDRSSLLDKQGYTNIKQFLDEMAVLVPAYKHVMQKFQAMKPTATKNGANEKSDN
jgi:DNA-binding transcriptional regulator GbsR (MarR family)